MADSDEETVVPLYEEALTAGTRVMETGQVHVHVRTQETQYTLRGSLTSQMVEIDRAPVGRFVDEPPQTREEGDVTIVPVVEERWVKRLFLIEEVRITRTQQLVPHSETFTLRRQDAVTERTEPQ